MNHPTPGEEFANIHYTRLNCAQLVDAVWRAHFARRLPVPPPEMIPKADPARSQMFGRLLARHRHLYEWDDHPKNGDGVLFRCGVRLQMAVVLRRGEALRALRTGEEHPSVSRFVSLESLSGAEYFRPLETIG